MRPTHGKMSVTLPVTVMKLLIKSIEGRKDSFRIIVWGYRQSWQGGPRSTDSYRRSRGRGLAHISIEWKQIKEEASAGCNSQSPHFRDPFPPNFALPPKCSTDGTTTWTFKLSACVCRAGRGCISHSNHDLLHEKATRSVLVLSEWGGGT